MQTAEILKRLMDSQGISQNQLSQETELNQSTISGIIRGRSKSPSDEVLFPLANFFDVSLAQLRGYEPIADFGNEDSHDLRILKHFAPCFRLAVGDSGQDDFALWLVGKFPKNRASQLAVTTGPPSKNTFCTWCPDNGMAPDYPLDKPIFIHTEDTYAMEDQPGDRCVLIKKGSAYALRDEVATIDGVKYAPLNDKFETYDRDEIEVIGWLSGEPEKVTYGKRRSQPHILSYVEAYAVGAGWLDTTV